MRNIFVIISLLVVLLSGSAVYSLFIHNGSKNSQEANSVLTSKENQPFEVTREESTATPNTSSAKTTPVLRIHGSNTIGAKLMPLFIENFLKSIHAEDITKVQKNPDEDFIFYRLHGSDKEECIELFSHGSSTAFEDLSNANCDIGMSSRKIKQSEIQKLEAYGLGNLSSPVSEHIIALDGIAVIVNNLNPVNHLSKEQLSQIFQGKITNWSQLGGKNEKINIYSRDEKSGTYDTFKNLVLHSSMLSKNAQKIEDSRTLSDEVSKDTGGIGFIGLSYIGKSKPIAISDNELNSFLPSVFNITTEDYPLTRRLYLYVPSTSKHTLGKQLIEYILSEEGQYLVSQVDLASQQVKIESQQINTKEHWESEALKEKYYQSIHRSKGRLSVNIRFSSGSYALDNKALKDVDRIVQLLNRGSYLDYNIILVGFSDNIGNYEENIKLSQKRADALKKILVSKNNALEKRISVVGMGAEKPIASNMTPEGKERNRRVEIWLASK